MRQYKSKALLLELEAFVADNSIRRSVLLCGTNAQNSDNEIQDLSFSLKNSSAAPNNTKTISCITGNKTTVIRCTGGPLKVTIGLGTAFPIDFTMDSLLVLSTPVSSLVLTNESLAKDLQVRILQI